MTPALDKLLHAEPDEIGSPAWTEDLFRRAYFDGPRQFGEVCKRLALNNSPLVYLPGNCMHAAATVVKKDLGNNYAWQDYLEHAEGGIEGVWGGASAVVTSIKQWLSKELGKPPAAIFHNLDFLTDGSGNLYGSAHAKTAMAGIVAATRQSVVLGLSDRDEPELPTAITHAFAETFRLKEIPADNFGWLIPRRLGEKMQAWGDWTDARVWLLASRLRWMDPPRVYRILSAAHAGQQDFEGVFAEVVKLTQTVNFESPTAPAVPKGVSPGVLDSVDHNLVRPFSRWRGFSGNREAFERTVRKLPPGAILHGPSGTGKTFIARYIASAIGLPVRVVTAAEIRAGLYGESERNVCALFRDLRRAAPCVLILDDADDLLPDRERVQGAVASADQAVVNVFLQQLDGWYGRLEGILIILTTNRFNYLDAAAKTRLPLHIRVGYPRDEDVTDLVDTIAADFGYTLGGDVRNALVRRFQTAIGPIQAPKERADDGYFSPRLIQQAMRMLDSWEGREGETYAPTLADVERMTGYYT